MIRKEVQAMIPNIQSFCVSQLITNAWLFGSCSRGEEICESNIDLLVKYDGLNERISLMRIAGVMIGLVDLLSRKVDMVESGRLLPFAQESVD